METIRIQGHTIEYELITPADFLSDSVGVPVSMFVEKKVQTMYEQAKTALQTDAEKRKSSEKEVEYAKFVVDTKIISIKRDILKHGGKMFTKTIKKEELKEEEIMALSNLIFISSLKVFNKPIEMDVNQCYFYDAMAKRYGTTPIECLYPNGGYTELDAYMFNRYVMSKAVERENKQQRKLEAERRKNKLRGRR